MGTSSSEPNASTVALMFQIGGEVAGGLFLQRGADLGQLGESDLIAFGNHCDVLELRRRFHGFSLV
jgi:hypothetical protein